MLNKLNILQRPTSFAIPYFVYAQECNKLPPSDRGASNASVSEKPLTHSKLKHEIHCKKMPYKCFVIVEQ